MPTNIVTIVLMVANAFIWLHNLKNNFGVRLKIPVYTRLAVH